MKKREMLMRMENANPEAIEALRLFHRITGQMEAFNTIEKFSRAARAKLFLILRESGAYKYIEGCNTLIDVFEKFGVAKSTGYMELEAIDNLGEELMEIMDDMGISTSDMYLISKGIEKIEGEEFEVLDADKGEYRINDVILYAEDDKAAVAAAVKKLINRFKREKLVAKGLEKKTEEQANEIEKFREALRNGERQWQKRENEIKGFVYTKFDRAMSEFLKAAKVLSVTEWTEKDLKLVKRHYSEIYDSIIQPMNQLFQDKTAELEEIEAGRYCRREGDGCEEDQGETIDEEDRAGGIA